MTRISSGVSYKSQFIHLVSYYNSCGKEKDSRVVQHLWDGIAIRGMLMSAEGLRFKMELELS